MLRGGRSHGFADRRGAQAVRPLTILPPAARGSFLRASRGPVGRITVAVDCVQDRVWGGIGHARIITAWTKNAGELTPELIPFRFVSGIMSACQRYSIRR